MKRGYLFNVTMLLLVIPLLLLIATYQQVSDYVLHAQSQRLLIERQYFSITTIQDDLQNIVELSFKRAYLTLTEYVINNNFVNNASLELKNLMIYGTLNGVPQKNMDNLTIKSWFKNTVIYLNSIGMRIEPSTPDEFVKDHLEVTIGPLDSFHVVVRVKIRNITITDTSKAVVYSGDIPPEKNKYIYSVISVVGFEDPFIVRKLDGLYTRVIIPCKIPFPGDTYGYYNISDLDDINELVLNWCYVGLKDNSSMKYPTILERFEGNMNNHNYYLRLAETFQKSLNFTQDFPVGLVTFLVPDSSIDPELLGALTSIGSSVPDNYTSVSYYFLRCAIDGEDCKGGTSIYYEAFKLDNTTKSLVFGSG